MPKTRKKVIKTVYKDEDDSEVEEAFSDSGSEAKISEESSSDDEIEEQNASSGDDFKNSKKSSRNTARKPKFAKSFLNKINKQQSFADDDNEDGAPPPHLFSVKDLTEEDKLLPPILNLSESDSSDDESQKPATKSASSTMLPRKHSTDSENDEKVEYRDVWSNNLQENSEEIARKAFLELEKHKLLIEETKASLDKYTHKEMKGEDFDVKDLLAQGEEIISPKTTPTRKAIRSKKVKDDSESETEDWEEVKESKAIPQQGLQLVVEFPDAVRRKAKKVDIEMMMKRKMNRVKKEYQVYMHKVHVLCWLGHGNYVSRVLNDQEILAAVLTLVPSKECYPGERVDMKYLEQITTWYKDKFTLKQDKNENKFKPKAPPLKDLLISQIKSRVVTTKKYLVYIFVCMLRALGLQCRIMFNFTTLPLKPPSSELCSLSIKPKEDKTTAQKNTIKETKHTETKTSIKKKTNTKKTPSKEKISQVDGVDDVNCFENIVQLDGNNDPSTVQTRSARTRKQKATNTNSVQDDVSPPKKARKSPCSSPRSSKTANSSRSNSTNNKEVKTNNNETKRKSPARTVIKDETEPNESIGSVIKNIGSPRRSTKNEEEKSNKKSVKINENKRKSPDKTVIKNETVPNESTGSVTKDTVSPRKTRNASKNKLQSYKIDKSNVEVSKATKRNKLNTPVIVVTKDSGNVSSLYFNDKKESEDNDNLRLSRKRSKTTTPSTSQATENKKDLAKNITKTRTKSAPGTHVEKSEYFNKDTETSPSQSKKPRLSLRKPKKEEEDNKRVSHRDLIKIKPNKSDVKDDLVSIIKGRIKEVKEGSKKGIVKGKGNESDEDSHYLPEEDSKRRKSADSDEDFKPTKLTPKPPKPSTSKKIDRRVLSSSEEDLPKNKIDVWCEVFVEELEQWICVDVVKAKVHCAESLYSNATHPVCYVVGWDNNNYLKDLTRRYVPHWNTVTRKQRAEPEWWKVAVQPWLGPRNARDKEEDEQLDRMQLEAPLPKSIAEYKNHPLYALKRHLLKYEALYPPDAAVLGFVRNEPVYARDCVYVCRSRDTWLKEAKVVRLGEQPYKVVKARPKYDRLSNKLITDKPLDIFGPWQVQDYEPPTAENGIVPRNAYGNVELFKDCMLPKGTVHIKLPGLNKVAKKLNIDCAPAMTGFDFNGGWSHPVYDGFVVCKEYEEIITEAWVEDQEDQERKEREKIDARVYGNWRRLIKGLLIRERLKLKYGFEEPSTSEDKKKAKGPRLVVKKNK